jgi:hypothetical protein
LPDGRIMPAARRTFRRCHLALICALRRILGFLVRANLLLYFVDDVVHPGLGRDFDGGVAAFRN